MDMFKLQLIYYHGLFSRALVLRVLFLSAAVAVLPFLARDPPLDPDSPSDPDARCGGAAAAYQAHSSSPSISPTVLDAALLDLLAAGFLSPGGRSLCFGPGAAAASAAMRKLGLPPDQLAVAAPADVCRSRGRLPFGDAAFDFVLSAGGLDRARAPARVALEMERVLAPGGTGAILAGGPPERPRSLVRTAAPLAAMLRASDVVAVRTVNSSAVVVVFRKTGTPGVAAE